MSNLENRNSISIAIDNSPKNNRKNENKFLGYIKCLFSNFKNFFISKNKVSNKNENINQKLKESVEYYTKKYKDKVNYHLIDPFNSKEGMVNLLNDCYIISFIQILFHTPKFLDILKMLKKDDDSIIHKLILVSEFPFNAHYFYELKQSFERFNSEYTNSRPNDSQEFGIDLINYLITEQKEPFDDNFDNEILNCQNEEELIKNKKIIYENFIKTYRIKLNEIGKLFVFNQINIFCSKSFQKPNISSNLHIELTLQKVMMNCVKIEELINIKYNQDKTNFINPERIVIKSKLASLPNILIISINRVLNNEGINNCQIQFDDILDLGKYIDEDLFDDDNKKTTYQLYAINKCIHGYKSSHNICIIKIENRWFIFDDDKTSEYIKYDKSNISGSVVGLFYIRDK